MERGILWNKFFPHIMEITYQLLDVCSEAEIIQWLELYQICYFRKVGREYWHWIHQGSPFFKNQKPMVFVAKCNNQIIGSVSLIPSPLRITNGQVSRTLNSCLVCKAMVKPEFQKRGIFSSLLHNATEQAKYDEYDLLVTFSNNDNSHKGFIKAGFSSITNIIQSKCYLSSKTPLKNFPSMLPGFLRTTIGYPISWLCRQLLPIPRHNYRVEFRDVTKYHEAVELIAASHYTGGTCIRGVRTPSFIQWRFSYPGLWFKCLSLWDNETMLAYVIIEYQDGDKNALIIDIFVRDDDNSLLTILIGELTAILYQEQFDSVQTYFLKTDRGVSNFFTLRHGFIDRTRGKGKKNTSVRFLCYPLNESMGVTDFSKNVHWNIQAADTCLFLGK